MTIPQQDPNMREHIRHSNLIEGIDDPSEDRRSLRTWNWLVGNQDMMSTGLVLEVHRRITLKQLPKHQRGNWRTVQVYVGSHVPPPPIVAKVEISKFIDALRLHWDTRDPKAMHVEFERIHPFIDGNGRTGRMLMWWHELKLGRTPTLIKVEERQEYYQWFKERKES